MGKRLSDFDILSFDCYGTLIDWETGIWDALQPLLMRNPGQAVGHEEALQAFASHESRVQEEHPGLIYPELLARVHADLASGFALSSTPELDRAFGASVGEWPAFADTAEALRSLKQRFRLVILSNVDHGSFAGSQRKLGVEFDAVYTAQDIGSYKPSPANFRYLIDRVERDFGRGPDAILHTAQSLYHDHAPARSCGLANAWIDRQRLSEEGGWGATAALAERPPVDFRFYSMAELAAAVGSEKD
jgi:2-haloalkanoic acid dehalogenase type II